MQLVRLAGINIIMSYFNGLSTIASNMVSMTCGYIAFRAATDATLKQVEQLRSTLDDYVLYIDDFSDSRYLSAHADFHIFLADMTQNPFCVMLVKTMLQAIPQTLREREFIFLKGLDLQQLPEAHMDFERELVLKVYPAKADF